MTHRVDSQVSPQIGLRTFHNGIDNEHTMSTYLLTVYIFIIIEYISTHYCYFT